MERNKKGFRIENDIIETKIKIWKGYNYDNQVFNF